VLFQLRYVDRPSVSEECNQIRFLTEYLYYKSTKNDDSVGFRTLKKILVLLVAVWQK